MKQPAGMPGGAPRRTDGAMKNAIFWLLLLAGMLYLLRIGSMAQELQQLSYSEFFSLLKANRDTHEIAEAYKVDSIVRGRYQDGRQFEVYIPEMDQDLIRLLRENVEGFRVRPPRLWVSLLNLFAPTILFFVLLWFLFYRGAAQVGGGGRLWSFGKSRAVQFTGGDGTQRVTFEDVAGVDEAREELKEIIDYLKDPKRFQRLGGKIPKGVLLIGPPGTGKTLLAKAVANEAAVPFLSISGSDFVEMFVGVGASRVRDLFQEAKKAAKASGKGAVIFIDEIDAVGRMRFAGIGGGHDEREQTLNALLVEMDGFNTQEGVILIAASNRPDVLDPALLRPGRFDRTVVIDRPDIKGREAILKVHTRKVKLAPGVTLEAVARQTPGFSGADLANLANEGALLAARRNKDAVESQDLEDAIDRVMAGPERKSRVISKEEKKMVAYHEAGHALLALLTPGADPLHKVSIIPRGIAALGYTMQIPLQDRYIVTKTELLGRLTVLLGGRVSEELTFQEVTTGAQNDLEGATQIAHKMVCEFGMSERLGHLTFGKREGLVFLGRDIVEERNFSDQTAQMIDEEVRRIVDGAYAQAKEQLTRHREQLQLLAEKLLEREVMDSDEVKALLHLPQPTTDGS